MLQTSGSSWPPLCSAENLGVGPSQHSLALVFVLLHERPAKKHGVWLCVLFLFPAGPKGHLLETREARTELTPLSKTSPERCLAN